MQKIYTTNNSTVAGIATKEENKSNGPRESTLKFLQQFARSYSFEPRLGNELGGMMAN